MGRQATPEQFDLMGRFYELLWGPTGDGAAKRTRGEKEPWYTESPTDHILAAERHMLASLDGDGIDPDSGSPHLAHAAWRILAACCILHGYTPND